jgi:hypothetical protein
MILRSNRHLMPGPSRSTGLGSFPPERSVSANGTIVTSAVGGKPDAGPRLPRPLLVDPVRTMDSAQQLQ